MSEYLKDRYNIKSVHKISNHPHIASSKNSVPKSSSTQISPQPAKPARLSTLTPSNEKKSVKTAEPIINSTQQPYKEKFLKNKSSEEAEERTTNKSSSPLHQKLNDSDLKISKGNKSATRFEYKPYTIIDYKNIRANKYYMLGGLGPTKIGTEDWCRKKQLYDKKQSYGKRIYYNNAANLPIVTKSSQKLKEFKNFRYRALEFAKTIIKPPLKVPKLFSI